MIYKDIELRVGDFRELLPISDVQTFIVDPPYNVKYNYHRKNDKERYKANSSDNFTDEEYKQFNKDILDLTFISSKENASLFLINTPRNTFELYETIKKSDWEYNQTIHWVYPNNMGRSVNKFTPCTRYVTWLVKNKDYKRYVERIYQPYKNKEKKITEQKAKGKLGANLYDWWHINIVKNRSSEKVEYVNQLPRELLNRLIITTSDKGDLIADVNCGTGSVMFASHSLGRPSWGCDINIDLQKIWTDQVHQDTQASSLQTLFEEELSEKDLTKLINVGTGIKEYG